MWRSCADESGGGGGSGACMWMWCSRTDESAGGGGGGGCVDTDSVRGCGAVELTSLVVSFTVALWVATATAVARWADVVLVDVDVVQSS